MKKRLAAALIVFGLGIIGGSVWWIQQATLPAGGSVPLRVTVPKGASAASVGQELQMRGVIRSARLFSYLGRDAKIPPGIYDLSPRESPARILRHLEKGDFATIRVTFPEGFTVAQIAHRLKRQEVITNENAFLKLVTQHGNLLHASVPLPTNLEGWLFPDTYKFPIGENEPLVAQRMVDTFDRLIVQGKAGDVQKSGHSLADIVNVAAMVEREAETNADRAPIAGVIYNRLTKNMRLQIDATVQYARGVHKNRLMFDDLKIDSPYNTYKVNGLPAGPICCPGLLSIEAALHPAKSDYLFYVGRPDGSHIFARTFEEHTKNIASARGLPKPAPKF